MDWMIAQDSRGHEPLVTFRVGSRVDELAEGERLEAEQAPEHRPAYLTYQGPLSDDRGTVTRIARGVVVSSDAAPDLWQLEVHWDAPGGGVRPQRLRLWRGPRGIWIVEAVPAQAGATPEAGSGLPAGLGSA